MDWFQQGQDRVLYEHSNEPLGSVKVGNFFSRKSMYQ
jgi:hypothetical protein